MWSALIGCHAGTALGAHFRERQIHPHASSTKPPPPKEIHSETEQAPPSFCLHQRSRIVPCPCTGSPCCCRGRHALQVFLARSAPSQTRPQQPRLRIPRASAPAKKATDVITCAFPNGGPSRESQRCPRWLRIGQVFWLILPETFAQHGWVKREHSLSRSQKTG